MEEAEAALPKGADELDSVLKSALPTSSPSHEAGATAFSLQKLSLDGKVVSWSDARVVEEGNGGFGIPEKSGEKLDAERYEEEELAGRKERVADVELCVTFKGELVEKNVVDKEELAGEADGTPKDAVEKSIVESTPYPQRPGTLDCAYYLRTGIERDEKEELAGRKERVADVELCVKFKGEKVENVVDKEELAGEADGTPKYEVEKSLVESTPYPQRPVTLDCAYYLRTGICRYGENCKFNHPPKKLVREVGKELSGKDGRLDCKFFLTPGGCKFGNACRFSHSQEKNEILVINFNFLGLPIRPGQKECPYYMRTGNCKFSRNCWYTHPDPTVVNAQDYLLGCQNGVPPQQHASVETNLPTSCFGRNSGKVVPDSDPLLHCIPSTLFPPKGLNFTANFRSQVPASQFNEPSLINLVSNKKITPQQADVPHPERPDQPDCPYFMKTGDCKFRSACKFHHPRSRLLTGTSGCNINPLGLPLRPDQPICTFYNRFGICKFGPACKFDHPMSLAFSSLAAASFEEASDGIEQTKEVKVAGND